MNSGEIGTVMEASLVLILNLGHRHLYTTAVLVIKIYFTP